MAIKTGDKLIARHYTGGYEVKARALYQSGEPDQAIKVLELGVQKAPGIFLLWSYLGEYYSNVRRYQDAIAAFRRSEMAGCNPNMARYNVAVVYARAGDGAGAAQSIEGVVPVSADHEHNIAGVKCWAMILEASWDEAIDFAQDRLKKHEAHKDLLAYEAYARMKLGQSEEALRLAWQVVELSEPQEYALEVIREITGRKSEGSKRYRLMVVGRHSVQHSSGPIRDLPFMRVYWVQAVSVEEGLEYVRPFEKETIAPLAVEEAVELDEQIGGNDGVYSFDEHYLATLDQIPRQLRSKMRRIQ
ncbi:MAG: tetratricopeptide repeat protein [Fimbriimonadaceae bacterium]|nr:tetratricopeptide repeat protein [Fimbriimonadaceae bacterium]